MGQLFASLNKNVFAEMFMITYLNRRGITPHNFEMFPGGEIERGDDDSVRRHKFRVALYRQAQLNRALREIQRGGLSRCMSPCLIREFNEGKHGTRVDLNGNVYETAGTGENGEASRVYGGEFGTLGRLMTDGGSSQFANDGVSSEEIVAYDVVKDEKVQKEPLRGSQKEKRARSRPEPRSRMAGGCSGQRHCMSVTQVKNEPRQMNLSESPSYVVVERIALGNVKKSKASWPAKESVRNTLKDPKTRPTSYFLARFRPTPDSDFVEIDYRFSKITGKDAFQITSGSLEQLLPGSALAEYQADIENNNCVDVKETFVKNLPTFFNQLEGRIWWNGFVACVDGPLEHRMVLKAVTFDPPAFIFEMSGLRHISATRNDTRLTFKGDNRDDNAVGGDQTIISRTFTVRGRTEQDMKLLNISHDDGTTLVKLTFPMLSSIPISTKSSGARVDLKNMDLEEEPHPIHLSTEKD